MAGDWIPMRLDICEDPAVIQMAEQLGIREEFVVGLLHKVWSWASRQCHGGRVTNVTLLSLERVTNVTGFTSIMRDAGWIAEERDEHGKPVVVFPKWDNWLSNSAKERLNAAKRQAKRRKEGNSASHADVTEMSRSKRDKNVTTVQESTGEKSNKKNTKKSVSIPDGVPSELWDDFLQVRRTKRAGVVTQTALNGLVREAGKAGMSLSDAICLAVERSWSGFRAEWVEKDSQHPPKQIVPDLKKVTREEWLNS
jgi:hypothetical protein